MARRRGKRAVSRHTMMWAIIGVAVVTSAYAFSSGYERDPYRLVAVGNESDVQCMGGADAKCKCGTGLKDGKCDPKKKGGGKIECPCVDVTSGFPTTGKCGAVGKCKGEKTDGMPPMLPMIPMMMPMMDMPMMPNCPPKTATTTQCMFRDASYDEGKTTEGTSTAGLCLPSGTCSERTAYIASFRCTAGKWVSSTSTEAQDAISAALRKTEGSYDPNCSQDGSQGGYDSGSGSYWSPSYFGEDGGSGGGGGGGGDDGSGGSDDSDTSGSGSGSGSGSVWGRIMDSLGINSGGGGSTSGDDENEGEGGLGLSGKGSVQLTSKVGAKSGSGAQSGGPAAGSTTSDGSYTSPQTFATYDLALPGGGDSFGRSEMGPNTFVDSVNDPASALSALYALLLKLLAIVMSWLNA